MDRRGFNRHLLGAAAGLTGAAAPWSALARPPAPAARSIPWLRAFDGLQADVPRRPMALRGRVPAALAGVVSRSIAVPTIGIGAGPETDGQVLVMHDMLDVYPGRKARFVKNFMADAGTIQQAVTNYVQQVKAATFPAPEHCY